MSDNLNTYSLLNNIKSKYLISKIFSHTSTPLKYQIIRYSKFFQKKLDISLYDYIFLYLKPYKLEFGTGFLLNLEEELNREKFIQAINEKLEPFSINFTLLKDILGYITKKNKDLIKDIFDFNEYYDIYYPFIDILLDNKYYINVPLNKIESKNLKNDYISFINNNRNKLSKINVEFDDYEKQIKILKDLNIDLSKIENIFIFYKHDDQIKKSEEFYTKQNLFFNYILTNKNIIKNLLTIVLNFSYIGSFIKPENLEPINNLEALKELNLYNIYFNEKEKFILKLSNLEKIHFSYVENIIFENELTPQNVKSLSLYGSDILAEKKNFYKFFKLENLSLEMSGVYMDYTSLKNLKDLKCDFIKIFEDMYEYAPLKKLDIFQIRDDFTHRYLGEEFEYNEEYEKKLMELIINNKTLNDVTVQLTYLKNDEVEKIKGVNTSIKKLYIDNTDIKFNIDNRIYFKKFINVNNLIITEINNRIMDLTIENDNNIILEEVKNESGKELYFNFSKIKKLEILTYTLRKILFPLFSDKCDYIFDSLEELYLDTMHYTYEKLYNNLDKCPKLKKLNCILSLNSEENFDKEFYIKFIDKLVELKILKFDFNIERSGINPEYFEDSIHLSDIYPRKELNKMLKNKLLFEMDYTICKFDKI